MFFHLVALGLQLGADALPELAHRLLMHIPVDAPDLHAVLADAGPLGKAAPRASADKFVGFQCQSPFSSVFSGASCQDIKSVSSAGSCPVMSKYAIMPRSAATITPMGCISGLGVISKS